MGVSTYNYTMDFNYFNLEKKVADSSNQSRVKQPKLFVGCQWLSKGLVTLEMLPLSYSYLDCSTTASFTFHRMLHCHLCH